MLEFVQPNIDEATSRKARCVQPDVKVCAVNRIDVGMVESAFGLADFHLRRLRVAIERQLGRQCNSCSANVIGRDTARLNVRVRWNLRQRNSWIRYNNLKVVRACADSKY